MGPIANEGVAVIDCTGESSNTAIYIIGNNMNTIMAGRNVGSVGNNADKMGMSYVEI